MRGWQMCTASLARPSAGCPLPCWLTLLACQALWRCSVLWRRCCGSDSHPVLQRAGNKGGGGNSDGSDDWRLGTSGRMSKYFIILIMCLRLKRKDGGRAQPVIGPVFLTMLSAQNICARGWKNEDERRGTASHVSSFFPNTFCSEHLHLQLKREDEEKQPSTHPRCYIILCVLEKYSKHCLMKSVPAVPSRLSHTYFDSTGESSYYIINKFWELAVVSHWCSFMYWFVPVLSLKCSFIDLNFGKETVIRKIKCRYCRSDECQDFGG